MITDWHDLIVFDNENIVYTMILLMRKKNNQSMSETPVKSATAFRRICSKPEHVEKYLNELIAVGNNLGNKFEIYINFNPRDVLKAYHKFKMYLVEVDNQLAHGDMTALAKLRRSNHAWFASLNKDGTYFGRKKYFMFDLDTQDNVALNRVHNFILENGLELHYEHKSRNGYHLLVSPFDTRLFHEFKQTCDFEIEIKMDNMLQIYHN